MMGTAIVDLGTAANEINEHHAAALAAAQDALGHAKAAGELLSSVKATLPHGEFGKWIADNCQFTDRTARRYIQIAQRWDRIADAKRTRVSEMSVREALALTADQPAEPKPDGSAKPLLGDADAIRSVMKWPDIAIPYILVLNADGRTIEDIVATLGVNPDFARNVVDPVLTRTNADNPFHQAIDLYAELALCTGFVKVDGFLPAAIRFAETEGLKDAKTVLEADRRRWRLRYERLAAQESTLDMGQQLARSWRIRGIANAVMAVGLRSEVYESEDVTLFDVAEMFCNGRFPRD